MLFSPTLAQGDAGACEDPSTATGLSCFGGSWSLYFLTHYSDWVCQLILNFLGNFCVNKNWMDMITSFKIQPIAEEAVIPLGQ